MIDSVNASSALGPQFRQLQTPASTEQVSSGGLPPTKSAFEIAQQIQEVQVTNLERTLDAQKYVLDLLA